MSEVKELLEIAKRAASAAQAVILSHYEKYHVKSAIKLGDYNIGFKDNILTLPHYLAFLLRKY